MLRMAVPFIQVSMTSMIAMEITSGTQAPSRILIALAEKKTSSMTKRGRMRAVACQIGQRHSLQKTKNAINEVVIMVAVTATPEAAASALELLTTATSSSTARSSK